MEWFLSIFHAERGGRLKVYILAAQDKVREQLQKRLAENKKIEEIRTFQDYTRFVEQIVKYPPDLCFIRLGVDSIPGLKAAGMVQRINTDTRVVFVAEDSSFAVDAYEVGAYGYLVSPFKKEKLNKYLVNDE